MSRLTGSGSTFLGSKARMIFFKNSELFRPFFALFLGPILPYPKRGRFFFPVRTFFRVCKCSVSKRSAKKSSLFLVKAVPSYMGVVAIVVHATSQAYHIMGFEANSTCFGGAGRQL